MTHKILNKVSKETIPLKDSESFTLLKDKYKVISEGSEIDIDTNEGILLN